MVSSDIDIKMHTSLGKMMNIYIMDRKDNKDVFRKEEYKSRTNRRGDTNGKRMHCKTWIYIKTVSSDIDIKTQTSNQEQIVGMGYACI